jgi:hypothetical protein
MDRTKAITTVREDIEEGEIEENRDVQKFRN